MVTTVNVGSKALESRKEVVEDCGTTILIKFI